MLHEPGLQQQLNTSRFYRFAKRTGDIVLSLAGLIVLSPFLGLVALLIHLEDGGNVIFCQERAGMNNRTFKMYKFRSMVKDAAAMRSSMEQYNELDGPAFKMKDDPRVTRIGRFIRRTSIDELPQLVNILRGEMSLVGPRPLATYESELCSEYQLQRLLVKPGLTCYWQVSGRNDTGFDEWIEMDLKYIREAGILTDLKILLRTVKTVLTREGAY